jgi:hypothetical protein
MLLRAGFVGRIGQPLRGLGGGPVLPTLDLDFLNAGLDPRITFTRESNATLIGADGTLQYAPHNLVPFSEQFDDAAWTKTNASISANVEVAPDGTTTADKLVENTLSGVHSARYLVTAASLTTYTQSVYVKAAGRTKGQLQIYGSGGGSTVNFDLGAVTATAAGAYGGWAAASATIASIGSGWFRVTNTATTNSTLTAFNVEVFCSDASGAGTYTGDGTSGLFIWGAQANIGALQPYYPTTTAAYQGPRFDYDPITLAPRGLLIEEQRTNRIRNSTMQGAVAGSPGTAPTNWSVQAVAGTTASIVGAGVTGGISYTDVRFSGTPTATADLVVFFETVSGVAAANGQVWAASAWLSLVGGSLANVGVIRLRGDQFTAAQAYINTLSFDSTIHTTLASSLSRFLGATTTNNASTAFFRPAVGLAVTSGAAIDITLRIGLPQLELGAFATSAIPTSGAAATRAADVAVMTGANFSDWYNAGQGTVFAELTYFGQLIGSAAASNPIQIDDGTQNNRILIRTVRDSVNPQADVTVYSGGALQMDTAGLVPVAAGTVYKRAIAYAANNAQAANNGAPDGGTAVSFAVPVGVNALTVPGADTAMHIRRLSYYPRRLTNAQLQALTAEMQGAWLFNNPAQSGNLLTSGLM